MKQSDMSAHRPASGTFAPHFSKYIGLVDETDVVPVLERQIDSMSAAFGALPAEKAGHAYAPGKWTVREVLGHLVDCERIFGYRALSIARGERASLLPFDENVFAETAHHDACALGELLEEFTALRRSHVLMLRHLPDTAWDRLGTVSEHPCTARAWAFVMAGHLRHHARILAEKYSVAITA